MDVASTGATSDGTKRLGENHAPEYTAEGVGDPRVALFFALVRNIPTDRLHSLMDDILQTANGQMVADLVVMMVQTRNCRGGKGERDLFCHMLLRLHETYPRMIQAILPLIPQYGCYRDWFRIVSLATNTTKENEKKEPAAEEEKYSGLTEAILDLAKDQLWKDNKASQRIMAQNGQEKKKGKGLSLLAKWAPREGRLYDAQAKWLAQKMFPKSPCPKKDYRKLVASLNKVLDTTEIRMCANEFDSISFGKVPSKSLLKYRKAFLNERLDVAPKREQDETGNRHPDNEMRVRARKRLRETMLAEGQSKLKGKQLFPHEIAKNLMNANQAKTSISEKDLMQLQWEAIRMSVQEAMESVRRPGGDTSGAADSGKRVDLGKLVAMADVSGSMYGTPMEVSIALSILVSELASPVFAHRILTFHEQPSWVVMEESMSIAEKVAKTQHAPWGGNTDFEKAMELILQTAVQAKLSPEDIPDLIVFSDMQFDQARDHWNSSHVEWETLHERLVRRFEETGRQACGVPWPVPHVIFWNLRGDTEGFPAQASTEGVTMLSGFSPSLLKLLLSGEELEVEVVKEEVNDDGEVIIRKEKKKKNPYDTVRAALDDEVYDPVREVLASSTEGALVSYSWEPPIGEETEKDEWVAVDE